MRTNVSKVHFSIALLIAVTSAMFGGAAPIDVPGLEQAMISENPPLLIDIRSANEFQAGSIPGAVNVPTAFLSSREFPSLGGLVIFDQGLIREEVETAAEELASKHDFPIGWLQGGFLGWTEWGKPSTGVPGMRMEALPTLTYAQLDRIRPGDAVLFDLREDSTGDEFRPARAEDDAVLQYASQRRLELLREDPLRSLRRVERTHGDLAPASAAYPLIVLIDGNDGRAEEVARKLRANGYHRVMILLGGAGIIEHDGRPGRVRQSTGISIEVTPE